MKDKSSERLTKILRLKFSMKSSSIRLTAMWLTNISIPIIKRKKSIARRNRLEIGRIARAPLNGALAIQKIKRDCPF